MSKSFEDQLDKLASMGPKVNALFGATADVLRILRGKADNPESPEFLVGDPVADAAILRAMGVEKVIKDKWKVDVGQVIELLDFFGSAFSAACDFYKDIKKP
jgi:hypothetical protein